MGTGWDDLEKAREKYTSLLTEQKSLRRALGSLSHKRTKLEEADRIARAKAQYDDPKADVEPSPAIEKIEKESEAVKRRIESLEDAIDRAEAVLADVIEANKETWAEDISPEVDAAFSEYAKQIDVLEEARRKVAHKNSIYWWLRNFSTVNPKDASYRPPTGSWVVALKQFNGDPHFFSTVIDALRQDATRYIPNPEEEYIPWGDTAVRAAQAEQAARAAS
jgi:hypothetical protein